jgi:HSP20 family protein
MSFRKADRTPHDAFALMHQAVDEFEDWFDAARRRLMQATGRATGSDEWSPRIETVQRGADFVVRAELPGMTRHDVRVEIGERSLTIRGERKPQPRGESDRTYWNERRYGAFSREIPLPPGANGDAAAATFANGILEVTVPAASAGAKSGRRIDISGATAVRHSSRESQSRQGVGVGKSGS